MDQATAARHRLEAKGTGAYALGGSPTLRRRPGPGGANRRKPTWPLAAQQQSRAHLCPTKCLLHLAPLCSPRGSQATLIYRTAVYGPVCTVVWEGEAARPTPIPILEHRRSLEQPKPLPALSPPPPWLTASRLGQASLKKASYPDRL